ncbi:MAG: S8 family peptidase [Candidatus Levybacteria bacterium]|nr:S8 family peptidase [Candidatus Levybacteria bacterium]
MKKLSIPLIASFIILLLGLFNVFSSSVKAQDNNNHVPGQVLVKFKQGTPKQEIDRQLRGARAQIVDKIDLIDVLVLSVPEMAEDKVINALSKNPNVEFAELDYIATAFSTDTDFGLQWGLENTGQTIKGVTGVVDADIDGPTAWDTTQGGVKVAILDTGTDQNHEDLSSKVVLQRNFTDSPTIDDLYGHGTHVGGIVAAITNNNIGVAGGCPNCQLMNGKVLNDKGSGAYSWIVKGIGWAVQNNAKVINMSLGGPTKSSTLENAVNYAWNSGVVVVAAAGNSNNPSKTYPAAYTNVIAVAATDNKDNKASFSSYGAKWVDVAAPGVDIFSTFPNHPYKIGKSLNYDFGSGTSMATPMTSAVAALIWSTPYGTSASQVRTRLESTADKITGTGTYWSAGRVNASNAVAP